MIGAASGRLLFSARPFRSLPGDPLQPRPSTAPSSRRVPFPKHHPRLPLQPRLSTAPSSRRGPNPAALSAPAALSPRLVGTPFSWRGPIPAAPPTPAFPGPCLSDTPSSRQGTPKKFLSTSCLPSLAGSLRRPRCQKQTWRAAFRHLPAAPGRFWALSGLFRVLFGLFRVFFEKSWAKNFLFSPASGIIKPLTGTARR